MSSQGQPSSQGGPSNQQQPSNANDQVNTLRNLVVSLKESFAILTKTMATNIHHNCTIDTGMKAQEGKIKTFEKPLEEFISLCNQVERNLKTISDCAIQQRDSQKYIPFSFSSKLESTGPVELAAPSPGPDTLISYNQYMHIVRSQIGFTKQVNEILTDAASKAGIHEVVPQSQQPPPTPTLGNSS